MRTVADIIAQDDLETAFAKIYNQVIDKERMPHMQRDLEQLIAKAPEFGKPYSLLGYILMRNKNYELAEQYLKKCLELAPGYGDGYYRYLYFLVEVDRYDEAEAFICACLQVRTIDTRRILDEWDCLLEQTGRLQEAIAKKKERIPNTFDLDTLKYLDEELTKLEKKLAEAN